MKIAIVYNHDSQNMINLFWDCQQRKQSGRDTIKRLADVIEKQMRQMLSKGHVKWGFEMLWGGR